MKPQMNACRYGGCVRSVVLCLLLVFGLSLVATPVKAGPPLPPYAPVIQEDAKADPWIDVSRRVLSDDNRSIVDRLVLSCTRGMMSGLPFHFVISLVVEPEHQESSESSEASDGKRH